MSGHYSERGWVTGSVVDAETIRARIEASSLGTPAAKALRASVSDVTAAKVVGMADGMAAERRRILALLDDKAVVTRVADTLGMDFPGEYLAFDATRAVLAVLRERIEDES